MAGTAGIVGRIAIGDRVQAPAHEAVTTVGVVEPEVVAAVGRVGAEGGRYGSDRRAHHVFTGGPIQAVAAGEGGLRRTHRDAEAAIGGHLLGARAHAAQGADAEVVAVVDDADARAARGTQDIATHACAVHARVGHLQVVATVGHAGAHRLDAVGGHQFTGSTALDQHVAALITQFPTHFAGEGIELELDRQALGAGHGSASAAAVQFAQGESGTGVGIAHIADLAGYRWAGVHVAAEAITIDVVVRIVGAGVAGITLAIVVSVGLAGVDHTVAVVAEVADAVTVGVGTVV